VRLSLLAAFTGRKSRAAEFVTTVFAVLRIVYEGIVLHSQDQKHNPGSLISDEMTVSQSVVDGQLQRQSDLRTRFCLGDRNLEQSVASIQS
jgi:hypothetical protein